MKVLVTGAGGRLARRVMAALSPEHSVLGLARQELDITNQDAVRKAIVEFGPKAIINCAAWTAVDAAERYAPEAFAINARAVQMLAREADRAKALLVHYSTSFVFDGRARRPYTECDEPTPQGVYAWSKWAGERMLLGEPHPRPRGIYVLRIGPPEYGTAATTIIETLRSGGEPMVASDLMVSLSFSGDVAKATHELLAKRPPYGVYHVANKGSCSWRVFAIEAAGQLGVEPKFRTVLAADISTVAPRPSYGVLATNKLDIVGIKLPPWREALRRDLAGVTA
jgi:dTDP-4-dehydrorhamnose reductase